MQLQVLSSVGNLIILKNLLPKNEKSLKDAFLVHNKEFPKIVPENFFSDDDKFRYKKRVETALNLITRKLMIR